jgi:hypothetical protein
MAKNERFLMGNGKKMSDLGLVSINFGGIRILEKKLKN